MAFYRNLAIEFMLKQILVPIILIISGNIYKDYSKCYKYRSYFFVDLILLSGNVYTDISNYYCLVSFFFQDLLDSHMGCLAG